jgi:hypothetical protein
MYDFYSFYVHLFVTVINCQNNVKLRHERLLLHVVCREFHGFFFSFDIVYCQLNVKFRVSLKAFCVFLKYNSRSKPTASKSNELQITPLRILSTLLQYGLYSLQSRLFCTFIASFFC